MASNGIAPVIPASGEQTPLGTVIDRDRLFENFQDGRIFSPFDVTPRKLDDMLRVDGKARAIEQALTLPLRSASWHITAAKGDSGEADWLNDVMTRSPNAGGMSTPFELVLSQATSACLFRRAFFEKVFRYDEQGRVVYDAIEFRPAPTCALLYDTSSGRFRGFKQRVPVNHPQEKDGFVTIPQERSFVFIYGQHRRPIEGVSDLESCYALFELKQKIKFLWATFLENQTMPKAVAKHNVNDSTQIQEFAKKVASLKGGGVVGIGPDQDVTPFETSNAAGQAFADAIRFVDSEMFASVLAGFLELASAASLGRGSYALSESQSDFFLQSRQAVLTELAATVEGFLLADLVRYNFGSRAAVPNFHFDSLRVGDVQNSVTLLQALATAPQTVVPKEFVDLLTEKVAGLLDVDVDKVHQAIVQAQQQAPASPLGQLASGVSAAEQIVRAVQSGQAAQAALHG